VNVHTALPNHAEQFISVARQLKLDDVTLEINLSDEDRRAARIFGRQVQASRAYRLLVQAGLNGNVIARTCMMFWMMKPIDPETIRPQLERGWGHPYKRPHRRPQKIFSAFQLVCDNLACDLPGRRRFHREFCELAAIVFDHQRPEFRAKSEQVRSYCFRLKRARRIAASYQHTAAAPPPGCYFRLLKG
jgi:hypothetical protein